MNAARDDEADSNTTGASDACASCGTTREARAAVEKLDVTPELQIRQHELDRLLIISICTAIFGALAFAGAVLVSQAQDTGEALAKALEVIIASLSAIATAAAAIIALKLGVAAQRREEARDRKDDALNRARAGVMSARAVLQVGTLKDELKNWKNLQSMSKEHDSRLDAFRRMADSLRKDDRIHASDAALESLLPIGIDCPSNIIASHEMVKRLVANIDGLSNDRWNELKNDAKEELLNIWAKHLEAPHDLLVEIYATMLEFRVALAMSNDSLQTS